MLALLVTCTLSSRILVLPNQSPMKRLLLSAFLLVGIPALLIGQSSFTTDFTGVDKSKPKDLGFEVKGNYQRAVRYGELLKAKNVRDLISGYPENWIDVYVSVELFVHSHGVELYSSSSNAMLTAEQKRILADADLGSDITVQVKYKVKQADTEKEVAVNPAISSLKLSATVIPDQEAAYATGEKQMEQFLAESVMKKLPRNMSFQNELAKVLFTIAESGAVQNARLLKSTGDASTDQLLLNAFYKMPHWKPASISTGEKVKQDFVFLIRERGC